MDNLPGNSQRAKRESSEPQQEERKIEPVVTGKVIFRKKSLGRRFMDTFFASDTNSVFGYLLRDVLVPALQATATDLVTQGIQKAVYGSVRSPHTTRPTYSAGRPSVSYNSYSSGPRPAAPTVRSTSESRRPPMRAMAMSLGEIVLATRAEAEMTAEKMYECVEEYGTVTVADLKQLIGETPQYTDNKFGWDNLQTLDIQRVREGYVLLLPDPEDLQRR